MNMKQKLLYYLAFASASLLLVSCNSSESNTPGYLTADIRNSLNQPTILNLDDEIESVSYVPLEVTSDDASLIDGVTSYVITDKYIYILPVKEERIALFDKQGHFIKTLISPGQGPGEISEVIINMQADEKKNRLYLFGTNQILVYTLDGEFIQHISHDYQVVAQCLIEEERLAAISFPYQPFQGRGFGLGIFTTQGDTILMKNDFYSPLVPRENSGFTVCMTVAYSEPEHSLLFKTGSNDTVFRISNNTILPACILNLQNSNNEITRALDITDFSSLQKKLGEDNDIFISDIFETPKQYYFRFRYNQGHCVASVNKKTGKTLVEKCIQPGTLKEMADVNLQHGMLGTKSYHNFPVWGRVSGNELVQIVTPYELNFYKETQSISIPDNLNTKEEEGNPIFIFYKLKDQ
jgi:hypothetical protein